MADAAARYHRLLNEDVYFLTGTDEHGLKIEQKAEKLNMTPQQYVDGMAADIQKLWADLDITNDGFIRTTDDFHEKAIQKIFQQFLDQDDIYKGEPIFPRVDVEAEVAYIRDEMTGGAAKPAEETEASYIEVPTKDLIEFDDFDKVEMRVAEILEVTEVEKSNKLLRFKLNDGTKEGRTILSGIKKWYPEYAGLVGKKVAFVANLKPRKMMGEMSEGMLLSAEKDGNVILTILPDEIEAGSELG